MTIEKSSSLTVTHQGKESRVIVTACIVCAAFDEAAPPNPLPVMHSFPAIWDTGATNSVITKQVIDSCALVPTGVKPVRGVHGEKLSETYLVNIALPNGVSKPGLEVTRGDMPDGSPILIGMDIINMGDFSITNLNGHTVMSFRVPSCHEVDFVDIFNAHTKKMNYMAAHGVKQKSDGNPGYKKRQGKKRRR